MNIMLNKKNLVIFIGLSIFVFFTNIADIYSMLVDISRWVPVNTPPMSVGDEYHYFSILKMITFGELHDVPNVEFTRIIPYLINLPVYYIGSTLFDTRFGILFVRLFDMGLLFFSLYYFIGVINYINGWKGNIYFSLVTIFIIFYGFTGVKTIFSSYHTLSAFNYLADNSFIYTHSTINSLARAINSSTTAPIMLFIFSYRLKNKILSLTKFLIFLIILIYTSLPIAIAFGLISILLDIIHKIKPFEVVKNMLFGVLLGVTLIFVQQKLMFPVTESVEEVINLELHYNFKLEYFSATFITVIITYFGRKYLSPSIIIMLIVLSLFQPLAYILGGLHWNRLWLRSTIIPYISLLTYIMIVFSYYLLNYIFKKNIKVVSVAIISVLVVIIVKFGWGNAVYLEEHNERYTNNKDVLEYLLNDKEENIIITNSTNIAMLSQLYDIKSKPLMGNFSLQSDGYRKNLARAVVNFELLGVQEKVLIQNIDKHAPRRYWTRKRESIKLGAKDFENFYYDQILFASTYVSYNEKMLHDKIKNRANLLEDSFYSMQLDKSSIYSELKNKKLVIIVDKSMPIIQTLK